MTPGRWAKVEHAAAVAGLALALLAAVAALWLGDWRAWAAAGSFTIGAAFAEWSARVDAQPTPEPVPEHPRWR